MDGISTMSCEAVQKEPELVNATMSRTTSPRDDVLAGQPLRRLRRWRDRHPTPRRLAHARPPLGARDFLPRGRRLQ